MYIKRIVDRELAERLAATGAVVIEGPRACGKTETARQIAASEVLLDVDKDARVLAGIAPSQVLAGATPRLIDEWQLEPSPLPSPSKTQVHLTSNIVRTIASPPASRRYAYKPLGKRSPRKSAA